MMPDDFFKRLVLNPCINAFGQFSTFSPLVSQPTVAPFALAGVFTNRPVDMPMEDGGFASINQPMFGINLGAVSTQPLQDDQLWFAGDWYDIVDIRKDGQGGADLWLRKASQK